MTDINDACLLHTCDFLLEKLDDMGSEIHNERNFFQDGVDDIKGDYEFALKNGLSDEADVIKKRLDLYEAILADYDKFILSYTSERIKVRAEVFKLNEYSNENYLREYTLNEHRDELVGLMSLFNNVMKAENSEKFTTTIDDSEISRARS